MPIEFNGRLPSLTHNSKRRSCKTILHLKVRKKVVIWRVVKLVRRTFTLTERVLAILFLGLRRVIKKIVGIIKLVCLIRNLCLVSLALANENC
jgi:hypothetical protein